MNDPKQHKAISFIDAERVKHQNSLASLNPAAERIVLDATRDGIEQITEILVNRCNIKSLQIMASDDGKAGDLTLGLTQLNSHTLGDYLDDLKQWRQALSAKSEILIYDCPVVFESTFQNLLHRLARITGADVGAFVTFPDSIPATALASFPTIQQKRMPYSLMVAWQA